MKKNTKSESVYRQTIKNKPSNASSIMLNPQDFLKDSDTEMDEKDDEKVNISQRNLSQHTSNRSAKASAISSK